MRILLIIAGLIEFAFGLFSVLTIKSDIQLIVVLVLLGFGLTHVGMGLLIPDDNYKTWRRLAKFLDANEPPKEVGKARFGGLWRASAKEDAPDKKQP